MLAAADLVEIDGLYARYCHFFDLLDPDAVADIFTEDCLFETAARRFEGREAVRAYAKECAEQRPPTRHQTTDHLIEPLGEGARGRAYFTFSTVEDGKLETVVTGVYEDEFVKDGTRWRIKRHRTRPDGPGERPIYTGADAG